MDQRGAREKDPRRKGELPVREATDVERGRASGTDATTAPGEERQPERPRGRRSRREIDKHDVD
jgi:hypothetical protein